MHRKTWLVLLMASAFAIGMIGCAGEDGAPGPQGPEGPAGHDGENLKGVTYIGGQGEPCGHCHGAALVASYQGTHHAGAYEDLNEESGDERDNPYCLQCHTVGWDATVNYGDSTIADNDGPDLFGYDNYFQVEGDEAASRRDALENVQCESCHGPAGSEYGGQVAMTVNFVTVDSAGTGEGTMCYPCHEGSQLSELGMAGHITNAVLEERASCEPCHTSEGFVQANDPDYGIALDNMAIQNIDAFAGAQGVTEYHAFGCQTCHDPHSNAGDNHQLRTTQAVPVSYDPSVPDDTTTGLPSGPHKVVDGYGTGQLCMQCHHDRRSNTDIEEQIASGGSHWGPHHSPQMDMFAGVGCYQFADATYDTAHAHQGIDEACVTCHMIRTALVHGTVQEHSFHTFEPEASRDDGGTGSCYPCHQGITSFEDVDMGSGHTIDDIDAKMDALAVKLGFTDAADFSDNYDAGATDQTDVTRGAAYALKFVQNDGSHGVHNPDYAYDLLQNAIDELP